MTSGRPTRSISLLTLMALGVIGILGPFGSDLYLPALPQMAEDIGTSSEGIRIALSVFTLGMAGGQLIIGAISDRFGRKRLMVLGGLIVSFAALGASRAESLSVLIVTCVILGIGSSSGVVLGRAVIADKTTGVEATRYFTFLQMAVSMGPILGPVAGAIILQFGDWRLIFNCLSAFALIGALGAMMFVPETLEESNRQSGNPIKILKMMGVVLKERQYTFFALTIWLSFGMLFAYISTTSFIFQDMLEQTSTVFAADFALNGIGLVSASLLTARLAKRIPPEKIIVFGLSLQVFAMISLITVYSLGAVNVWTIVICLFLLVTSMGFIFGPATSLGIARVRFASGTALAMLGSFQFAAAAITSSLTTVVSTNPLVSFIVIGSVCTAASAMMAALGFRLIRSQSIPDPKE